MHYVIASLAFIITQLSPISSYYELIEELGCSDEDFRLQCPPLNAHIIVLEAFLQPTDYLPTCLPHSNNTAKTTTDIRHVFNKRCSGRNMCSLSLADDNPQSLARGGGAVYLRYACIDDSYVTKTCSAVVELSGEGFIQTPGYPKFYVGGRTCQWTIIAPHYQQVVVTLLDISLRGIEPGESRCRDWVSIRENNLELLAICGDPQRLHQLTSVGPHINITLYTASVNLFPKRGLLIHYKGVGCRADGAPQDGYVVGGNSSVVHYRCNPEYAFPDTGLRDRIVPCDGFLPHSLLPNCTYVGKHETGKPYNNSSSSRETIIIHRMNLTETTAMVRPRDAPGLYADIIVPSIIMAILLVGNIVVIAFVYLYKKRLLEAGPDPWENNCSLQTSQQPDENVGKSPTARTWETSH